MRIVFWDLETRSAVSLRDGGSYIYAIERTTQPLCLVFAIDDGEPQLWLPSDPKPPAVFLEIAANPADWQLVAHNYEFERHMLEHVSGSAYGFRPFPSHRTTARNG